MDRSADCFHCREPIPATGPIFAAIDNTQRPVCCIGCKAVAEFIYANDLGAFYQFRSEPRADLNLKAEGFEFSHLDTEDMITRYVHLRAGEAEATIFIGGMYCSACVWLLQSALERHSAIRSLDINPAARRAVIRWDFGALSFGALMATIARLGFKPEAVAAGQAVAAQDSDHRFALKRLIVAAVAGMQVMMFAVALYAGDAFGIDDQVAVFLRNMSLLVSLPIVFYCARPFFASAWRGIRARTPGMDLPVSIAIGSAFAASAWAVWSGRGQVYFDSVAMFVLFLSATRFLEMRARHRSDDYALALARLIPDTAVRLRGGEPETVAVDRLRVGDLLSVKSGDILPIDGKISTGRLSIDESLLTGEPLPVTREKGADVFAGSTVNSGSATVRVAFTGASTNLAETARLLERAKADRPPIAVLADQVASRFVVAVLLVAAIAGITWLKIDPTRAFPVVLATLVVTCPCALSLATPAALAAAASRLAKSGFLLVRSRILEVLKAGTTVVFDKTGTLTRGRPTVLKIRTLSWDVRFSEEYCLSLAAAIESASEHVLARAFSRYEFANIELHDAEPAPGQGMQATMGTDTYRIGNLDYVRALCGDGRDTRNDTQQTQVFLGNQDGLIAEFVIGDELRDDTKKTITALTDAGCRVAILSGDQAPAVRAVAETLGVADWHAAMSPADKLSFVAKRQSRGAKILMVGDGINDAPVLAAADASIAMDAGTALARASADAIALGARLMTIVEAAAVAARTRRIIRQNMAWAIAYNVIAVPMAVSGMLAPWMAALGMSLSSLIVVLNALRLHGFRPTAQTSARRDSRDALLERVPS